MEVDVNPIVKEAKSDNRNSSSEYPRITGERKRKHDLFDELDEESYHKDESPLCAVDDYSDGLAKRCLCLSTLIRNLSFVPGNDNEMAKHEGLMLVLSRLLLLNHEHSERRRQTRAPKKDLAEEPEESLFNEDPLDDKNNAGPLKDDDDLESGGNEWYWSAMHLILENSLVTLANISGQLEVSQFPESVSLPLLDGLLHWAVCPSSYAQDHLPTTSMINLSPQRLALETLVKFSIHDSNVDLILATPPWERLDRLFKQLAKMLSRNEDQTLREFSLVLLVNLTSADSSIARAVALTGNAIPQLISFVEQSEQSAMSVAHTHGVNALRENPELMGTTLDMVRRSALCLRNLARIPENRAFFCNYQQRLLNLVMSQILDQGVAGIMADIIYEISLSDPVLNITEPFLPVYHPIDDKLLTVKSSDDCQVPSPKVAMPIDSEHLKNELATELEAQKVVENHDVSLNEQLADEPSELLNVTQTRVTEELKPRLPPHPFITEATKEMTNHVNSHEDLPPHHPLDIMQVEPLTNDTNHSRTDPCPRLKELLFSYKLSPKSAYENSPTSGGVDQQTVMTPEQITS